jgi:hypothetical protein
VRDFPQEAADGGLFLLQEGAMKIRTHFTFRVDTWTPDGESIVEHVAGVEDCELAIATFRATCERWPGTPITLRQGARGDRGQPPSARGVESIKSTTFREVKKAPTSLYLGSKSPHW